MPVITPDLSEVSSLEPIQPGTYAGEIKSLVAKQSKAGNDMLEGKADIEVDGTSRTRTFWLTFRGKGAYNFEALLRACGFNQEADDFKSGKGSSFDTDALVGQRVNFVIENDTYNGNPTDKIKTFMKA